MRLFRLQGWGRALLLSAVLAMSAVCWIGCRGEPCVCFDDVDGETDQGGDNTGGNNTGSLICENGEAWIGYTYEYLLGNRYDFYIGLIVQRDGYYFQKRGVELNCGWNDFGNGRYYIDGDQLIATEDSGPDAGITRRFRYSISGNTMTMTEVRIDKTIVLTKTRNVNFNGNDCPNTNVYAQSDGIWLKIQGDREDRIELSGNNWVSSLGPVGNVAVYSKGTWSSNSEITAPSSGIITLTITHVISPIGVWVDFPPEYNSVKVNTVTYGLNAAGDVFTISNAALTTDGVWGSLEGTYRKQ